jgi:small conductance mechanosensitive channel
MLQNVNATIVAFFVTYGLQLVGAIIIIVGGAFVARWAGELMNRGLSKNELEPPVRLLLVRLVRLLVFAFTLIIALDKLGVQIGPLIAGIGVAGVGIGLATQGVLSNMVAGLTIIFVKPFRVGDYIEIHGVNGQVTAIELCSTILAHPDRSRVIVPNRKIVGEILHNYGRIRQAKLNVAISYDADIQNTLALIHEVMVANPRVLKDPAPGVGIQLLEDSSVNIAVTPWVALQDYGPAQAELYAAILQKFRERGIEIPFPQREVRLVNPTAA